MRDEALRARLAQIEEHGPPSAVAAKAHNRMLAVFDGVAELPDTDMKPSQDDRTTSEIIDLLDEAPRGPRHRRALWIPALAAAAVLIALLAGGVVHQMQNTPSNADPTEIADAQARPATGSDNERGSGPVLSTPIRELPMLVQGRFTSTELGTTMTFLAREPIWLTRSDPGVVEFSTDPTDRSAAHLVIARPNGPSELLQDTSLPLFLRTESTIVSGQVSPTVVDGVDSTYWTGRVGAQYAADNECEPDRACVVLYSQPIALGPRPGNSDLVERPMADGSTTLLIATGPDQIPGFEPFGGPWRSVFETITFDDTAAGEVTS